MLMIIKLNCVYYGPQLPENNALAELCGGMISAWEIYGNKK